MKMLGAALVAGTAAFTITIDDGTLGDIADSWSSNLEDFAQWSDQNDRDTLDEAEPYLEALDEELQNLYDISQQSELRWAENFNSTINAAMGDTLDDLGCQDVEGETYPYEYESCWEDCWNYETNEWDESACNYSCDTYTWDIEIQCNNPGWFLDWADPARDVTSFEMCQCENVPFSFEG